MGKAVMLSVRPEWCEKIISGEKTVEVRKSMPKLSAPFKCYIYCTKGDISYPVREGMVCHNSGGRVVIGEFVCSEVESFTTDYRMDREQTMRISRQSCVGMMDLAEYEYDAPCLFAWHISQLVIYDKPLSAMDFYKPDKCPYNKEDGCSYPYHCFRAGQLRRCGETLERAPQSWCYVEEV